MNQSLNLSSFAEQMLVHENAIVKSEIAGAGRIIAIDTNPAKLQLATKLGATDIIDPGNGDVVTAAYHRV